MKSLIIAAILSAGVFANASCIGEAQIIAKVNAIESKTIDSCRVSVKEVTFYRDSAVCPLNLSESDTIEVGMKDGHDCRLEASETLTGVLVKNQAGEIYLEQ